MTKPESSYDIFLSYNSADSEWVGQLREDLYRRGIRVWLDKHQIRPGDLFVRALENGLETSQTVGLVVTPESLASGWVEEEYSRAVALAASRRLKLIPLLLRDAPMPGFLAGRHFVDFRDKKDFGSSVDKLVWPGITGRKIAFFAVHSVGGVAWPDLEAIVRERGFDFHGCDYVETSSEDVADIQDAELVVVVCDMYEDWPWASNPGRGQSTYWEAISEIRLERKNLIVTYQHPDALQRAPSDLGTIAISDLRRFFVLPKWRVDRSHGRDHVSDEQRAVLRRDFEKVWLRIQNEFLQRIRSGSV